MLLPENILYYLQCIEWCNSIEKFQVFFNEFNDMQIKNINATPKYMLNGLLVWWKSMAALYIFSQCFVFLFIRYSCRHNVDRLQSTDLTVLIFLKKINTKAIRLNAKKYVNCKTKLQMHGFLRQKVCYDFE